MNEQDIMVAGDWHGDALWAQNCVHHAADMGMNYIFHVGDFGIWPGRFGQQFLEVLEESCQKRNVFIFVTPGNHEEWPRIDAHPVAEDGLQWFTNHIALIPRGHRWEMNGRTFVSLGGAPSIDFYLRTENVDWWRSEMIPLRVAEEVAEAGHADIMFTHDSPTVTTDAVHNIIFDENPFWAPEGLRYAAEGRAILDIAVDGVQPTLLMHGHFHIGGFKKFPDGRWVVSLDQQRTRMNMAMIDLDDLSFDLIDPFRDDKGIVETLYGT